jgi:hypothetical protein
MTFSTLQASSSGEEELVYVSKADEDEAVQWETLTGGIDGRDDEFRDDLRNLGLAADA